MGKGVFCILTSKVEIDTDKEIAISVASKEALTTALAKVYSDIAILEKKKVDLQAQIIQQDGKQVYLRSIPPTPSKEATGGITKEL